MGNIVKRQATLNPKNSTREFLSAMDMRAARFNTKVANTLGECEILTNKSETATSKRLCWIKEENNFISEGQNMDCVSTLHY